MQFEEILGGFEFLEAPRVDEAGRLYFSEVMQGGICRLSPDGSVERFLEDCTFIGGLALTEDGGLVCSGGSGLLYVHPETGVRRDVELHWAGPPLGPFNDLQPDAQGSLWLGTNAFRTGAADAGCTLLRRDPGGHVTLASDGLGIANGIGFAPGEAILYGNDTKAGVLAFDVQPDRTLANRRLLAPFAGVDGLAVDSAGGIWVAGYATGEIVRFRPDGAVDQRVDFSGRYPDCHVTSLTFGGPDLRDLYVVTAGDYRRRSEGTGRVYRGLAAVPGQPTPKVRL